MSGFLTNQNTSFTHYKLILLVSCKVSPFAYESSVKIGIGNLQQQNWPRLAVIFYEMPHSSLSPMLFEWSKM